MAAKKLDLVTWLKNWFESKTNKVTSLSSSSTDTEYPTAKAVYDAIQNSGGCVEDYYFDSTTKEIVIDYVCGSGSGGGSGSSGGITVDSTWVANSTNPVESQLIKSALDEKITKTSTDTGFLKSNGTIDNSTYLTTGTASSTYVAKETGKGLTSNDFTNTYKSSLDNLQPVATSGSFYDLVDYPSVPTDVSDLSDTNSIIPTDTSQLVNNGSGGTDSYAEMGDIPTNTSDLTNDGSDGTQTYIETSSIAGLLKNDGTVDTSTYLTSHQDISNYVQKSNTNGLLKNDGSVDTSSYITSSSLPTASTTTPSADTTSGSYGSGTSYARSNHTHPKSTLYAEASHTHSAYVNPTICDNLTTNDATQVLSAKQGKVLNDLIGQAIAYINQ